jgi:hypothetical protein
MPGELDPQLAGHIVSSAISRLNPSGNKVLHDAFLAVAQEAHDIGFLAGNKERERNRPEGRPAWMDIQLDPATLAKHHLHLKPVVLKSLHDAGYFSMGDLRWVPERQLRGLHYVGIKTAQKMWPSSDDGRGTTNPAKHHAHRYAVVPLLREDPVGVPHLLELSGHAETLAGSSKG